MRDTETETNYPKHGYRAFYSELLKEDSNEYFRVRLRILGRFGYRQPYVSDMWDLQSILMEGESFDNPENVANRLKKYFT